MSKLISVAMSQSSATVRYDRMCRAIVDAHKVDEVKDIRDKARAIEIYAQQALNIEAERQAGEIRYALNENAGSCCASSRRRRACSWPVESQMVRLGGRTTRPPKSCPTSASASSSRRTGRRWRP